LTATEAKRGGRSRLYLHIYFAILGIIVLVVALTIAIAKVFEDGLDDARKERSVSLIVAALIPPASAPTAELTRSLERWREQLQVDLTVRDADGQILAAAGPAVPMREGDRKAWVRARRGNFSAGVQLPDGRWALVGHARDQGPHWLWILVLFAGLVALGAYPLARRIARRLERLRIGVDELGQGDLTARVAVQGRDEVAALAESFNAAASRIEALVTSQTSMLAGASHELRSPLTRIRMAVELLGDDAQEALRRRVGRDIEELDELIEELLAASRFQVGGVDPAAVVPIDLLALVAEEAARVGGEVSGESVAIDGEVRWLKRLARNLLENARRHSQGEHIRARVVAVGDGAELSVEDDGDGVPTALRERIFEPFFRPDGMRESHDKGVGFGLALVRQIARRHGGDARCEEAPGGGSRFVVTLAGVPDVGDHHIKSSGT
tara:strand:- start:3982 stop:5298 length:1317 start_codon:yes stop_codon:yes gene_type:complete